MRFLHTADWHIGKIVNEFSMLAYQGRMIEQIIQLLETKNYDCLIIAGDLYDRAQPAQDAIQLVNQTFKTILVELKVPILLISGNHDSPIFIEYGNFVFEQNNFYTEGLLKPQIKRVTIKDTDFYLFPFVTPSEAARVYRNPEIKTYNDVFVSAMNTIELDLSKQNVLIAHGYIVKDGVVLEKEDSVRPLSIGTAEYVDSSSIEQFDYVALGHLHSHHHIGSAHIQYSGSLMKYSKSEVKNSISVVDVSFKDKQLVSQRIFLEPVKDMIIKQGYFKDLIQEPVYDFVFYELLDETIILDAMNKLRVVSPFAMGLSYVNIEFVSTIATVTQQDIENKSIMELFDDFYHETQSQILTDHQREYIQSIIEEDLS